MNDATMFQPLRFAGKPGYKSMIPFQVATERGGEFEVYMLDKIDFVKLYNAETGEEVAVELVGSRVKTVGKVKRGCECYGIAFGDSLERIKHLQALRELEESSKAEPVKGEVKKEVKP